VEVSPVDRYVRSFSSPDEVIELDRLRSEMITSGGLTVSLDTHHAGWRWSTHIRPLVKTEWCEVHHTGVLLSGRLRIELADGATFEIGPMSLVDIPPGHDGWVIGDEPAVMIAWTGAREWLAPLDTLADRVLATLVFTDIVDSTATATRIGRRAWSELLARHEARSRDIVARFRGRTVKMTGDGILAMFDGAARAVRSAATLRDAAIALGLQTRTAVHTGEVDVVDDDIHGLTIHEASRILSLAEPGEILISSATAGLARDAGFEFEDLGEHRLRGIEPSIHLHSVR
jgi:class 3 adenylate cyclase